VTRCIGVTSTAETPSTLAASLVGVAAITLVAWGAVRGDVPSIVIGSCTLVLILLVVGST